MTTATIDETFILELVVVPIDRNDGQADAYPSDHAYLAVKRNAKATLPAIVQNVGGEEYHAIPERYLAYQQATAPTRAEAVLRLLEKLGIA